MLNNMKSMKTTSIPFLTRYAAILVWKKYNFWHSTFLFIEPSFRKIPNFCWNFLQSRQNFDEHAGTHNGGLYIIWSPFCCLSLGTTFSLWKFVEDTQIGVFVGQGRSEITTQNNACLPCCLQTGCFSQKRLY